MSSVRLGRASAALALLLTTGCGPVPSAYGPAAVPFEETTSAVHVQDRWLQLHFSKFAAADRDPPFFVLYVTGDGGWRGKDLATFEQMRHWGLPVAGFSAPDYLDKLAGGEETLPPEDLARDFDLILAQVATAFALDPRRTPAVLVGVSRGADLVVIAAGSPAFRSRLAGVIAIALTDEEEYVRHPRHHLPHLGHDPSDEPALEMARPYDYLPRIGSPTALIQSTNDQYVPAAAAAVQFGPESPSRRFYPIQARNHSFSGARDVMYGALHASLDWVAGTTSVALTR